MINSAGFNSATTVFWPFKLVNDSVIDERNYECIGNVPTDVASVLSWESNGRFVTVMAKNVSHR
jgi:hypothetical protein